MSNITPIQQVIQTLETPAFKQQLQSLLPAHVKADQFLSVARRGIHGNKALNWSTMDKNTLYSSCLKAAEQGLKLDGEESALVQYGSNVQFMKMIKGVKKQLRNSGEIKEITAEVIYQNDKFEYWVDDDGKHLKHVPNFLQARGEPIAAYSIISTKDGGKFIKVMSKEEIMAVKGASKTGNAQFSPWNGAFQTEMWCKTVLRRNAKDAPSSTDLAEVFEDWDNDFDFNNTTKNASDLSGSQEIDEKKPAKKKTRLEKIVEADVQEIENPIEAAGDLSVNDEDLPI